MKKKQKKRKKTLYKKLIKKCDVSFSKLIRTRGKCQKCGKEKNLQCSHIIPKRFKALRWEPMNALCLCAGCHFFFWHENPLQAIWWLKKQKMRRSLSWFLFSAEQKGGWYFNGVFKPFKKEKLGVKDLEKVFSTIEKNL